MLTLMSKRGIRALVVLYMVFALSLGWQTIQPKPLGGALAIIQSAPLNLPMTVDPCWPLLEHEYLITVHGLGFYPQCPILR